MSAVDYAYALLRKSRDRWRNRGSELTAEITTLKARVKQVEFERDEAIKQRDAPVCRCNEYETCNVCLGYRE